MLVVAIVVGILWGALSVVPFAWASKKVKTVDPTFSFGLAGWFVAAIGLSFILLLAAIVACKFAFPSVILPFVIAELVAFIVAVLVFGVVLPRRGK